MSIIYHVAIEPTDKKDLFHITWTNPEENTRDSFEQNAEITPEEAEKLWWQPKYQWGIGEKLFRFLDGDTRHLLRALEHAHQQGESLQIFLHNTKETDDWPFELLARNNEFLLAQKIHLVRQVTRWGADKPLPPKNHPLKVLFMACSARGIKPVLDYEEEEEAIFEITENLAIDLDFEDSGSLEGLQRRLEQEYFDVLYLSGHADIDFSGNPYFLMEDETGVCRRVHPHEIWDKALIENAPRLLFLSGCRTAESPKRPENKEALSFARELVVKRNVPAVLGWGRPVKDKQAIHCAKMLFHELSRGKSLLHALQRIRYELLQNFPGDNLPAWPMLRLFSSGIPLHPFVTSGQRRIPKPQRLTQIFLKNSRIPVLSQGFIGRRRQLQISMQALHQAEEKIGILVLGTAGLGKSCLAAKICERFEQHTIIPIRGRLDSISLTSALKDAFIIAQDEKGQHILSQKSPMKDKLAELCSVSFKEKNYLIFLDDFDKNLEGNESHRPGPLLPEAAELLQALLHYLPNSGKMSQVIITSRYCFSLTENSRDLVNQRLKKGWLNSFTEAEQKKKRQRLSHIFTCADVLLREDLIRAGLGNPLLMMEIDTLVGEIGIENKMRLLTAVKEKLEEFRCKHGLRDLLAAGGESLKKFLQALATFHLPVKKITLEKMAEEKGFSQYLEFLQQGMGFGLIEYDQDREDYRITPLLREELTI